jgi:hypothetical protein
LRTHSGAGVAIVEQLRLPAHVRRVFTAEDDTHAVQLSLLKEAVDQFVA